ncbi:MAG: CRTAC1 family protein [Bacteroidota bacterium]
MASLPLGAQTFVNVAPQVGVTHTDNSTRPGGGVSFADFNGDGFDDLSFATAANEPLQFYQNSPTGLVLRPDPTGNLAEVKQLLWVDYDNDGDQDLFCSSFDGPVYLYRRDGDWQFTEVTSAAGLPVVTKRHYGAAFGDYDRDGWLDLYYSQRKLPGQISQSRNRLFRNQADGTFAEVTFPSGTEDPGRIPFCLGFTDYNADRWPDLYLANDRDTRNTLLENQANGTFTDVSEISGAGIRIDAMNMGLGDYDNDGDEDIYVTNIEEGCKLLRNNNDGTFTEVADEVGVGFYGIGWGGSWIDGDLDGDLDLYVSGAIVGSDAISSDYFRNDNEQGFSQPNAGFIGDTVYSWSNAVGDYNRDHLPDIAVLNQAPFPSQLWENRGNSTGASPNLAASYFEVQLQGVLSNRDGTGSKVELFGGPRNYQSVYTHCGSGFLAQQSRTVRFGLGNDSQFDSLVVTWPTGHRDVILAPTVNQTLLITEGQTTEGDIQVDEDVQLTIVSTVEAALAAYPVKVWPNPLPAAVPLQIDLPQDGWLSVYRTDGRQVAHQQVVAGESTVSLDQLAAGWYQLVLRFTDGTMLSRGLIRE